MCGRFNIIQANLNSIMEAFHLTTMVELILSPHYNFAPSQETIVLVNEGPQIVPRMMKWGLIPPWSKPEKPTIYINLRADTLQTKPTFTKFLRTSRCIVPADGFYEWKTEGKMKTPYRFVLEEGIFGFGGIYQESMDAKGTVHYTFCLITTEPNEVVAKVHDRMPVIVSKALASNWLNPKTLLSDVIACLGPYPAKSMKSYPVSTKLNSAKFDSEELIKPV